MIAGSNALRVRNALRSAVTELRYPSGKRIPFLDGLRTLAILLVINQHTSAAWEEKFGANRYTTFPLTVQGWMGVDLFFVLSGFFIGSQLWKELVRTGGVSIGGFMLRRTLRIWPLYFFVYGVVLLITPRAEVLAKHYGWTDVVFLVNYLGGGVVLGGWSLSTEEQFYLAAPLLLLLFRGRSLRWFRWMLAGLWVTEVAVRIVEYIRMAGAWRVKDPVAFTHLYYPFHTHSDGLIAGLVVANLVVAAQQPAAKAAAGFLARPWLVLLTGLVTMGVCWKLQSETLNFAGLAVLFAAVVWWGMHRFPNQMGSWPFYLGSRLSFGMYLIHPYVIHPLQHALGQHPAIWQAPLMVTAVVCVSAATSAVTFCLVEHPFLLLRTVLLRRRTAVPLVAH